LTNIYSGYALDSEGVTSRLGVKHFKEILKWVVLPHIYNGV